MIIPVRKKLRFVFVSISLLIFTIFTFVHQYQHEFPHSSDVKIEDFCANDTCVSRNISVRWDAMMNYAAKYKMANCAIQKSLSTLTMAILCYLHDEKRFEEMNRTLSEETWAIRLCEYNNTSNRPKMELLHDPTWKHIAVVREPVERFLSGWMDKCHNALDQNPHLVNNTKWCYGCNKDMTCFLQRNYKWMMNINYTDPYRIQDLEDHFWPQHWYCGFNEHFDNYNVLKFSNDRVVIQKMLSDLKKILLKQNVSEELANKIVSQASRKRSNHATVGQNSTSYYRKLLFSDSNAMRTLVKTYYNDFITFSFPFPQIPHEH